MTFSLLSSMSPSNSKSNSTVLPCLPPISSGLLPLIKDRNYLLSVGLWIILHERAVNDTGLLQSLKKVVFQLSHAAVSAGDLLTGLQRTMGTHVVLAHPPHCPPPSSLIPDFPLPDALAVLS